MATRKENKLMGYDPLAWMDDDEESPPNQPAQAVSGADPGFTSETGEITSDISVETDKREVVVDDKLFLEEKLTIQSVGRLHEQLMAAFDKYNRIEIDASRVSSIDTANLQLLIILKQEAIKLQKDVIINSASERFKEAAGLLGIAEMLGVA